MTYDYETKLIRVSTPNEQHHYYRYNPNNTVSYFKDDPEVTIKDFLSCYESCVKEHKDLLIEKLFSREEVQFNRFFVVLKITENIWNDENIQAIVKLVGEWSSNTFKLQKHTFSFYVHQFKSVGDGYLDLRWPFVYYRKENTTIIDLIDGLMDFIHESGIHSTLLMHHESDFNKQSDNDSDTDEYSAENCIEYKKGVHIEGFFLLPKKNPFRVSHDNDPNIDRNFYNMTRLWIRDEFVEENLNLMMIFKDETEPEQIKDDEENIEQYHELPKHILLLFKKVMNNNKIRVLKKLKLKDFWKVLIPSNVNESVCPNGKLHESSYIGGLSWNPGMRQIGFQCWSNDCKSKTTVGKRFKWEKIGTVLDCTPPDYLNKKVYLLSLCKKFEKWVTDPNNLCIEINESDCVKVVTEDEVSDKMVINSINEDNTVAIGDDAVVVDFVNVNITVERLDDNEISRLCDSNNVTGLINYLNKFIAFNRKMKQIVSRMGSKEWVPVSKEFLITYLRAWSISEGPDKSKKPISQVWLESRSAQRYDQSYWYPNVNHRIPFQMNEYTGWEFPGSKNKTVGQLKQSLKSWLFHYEYGLCGGDRDLFHYNMKWNSDIIHEPWKKTNVGLIFTSGHGMGKNVTFKVIERILGSHYAEIASAKKFFKGNFDGILKKKVLVLFDEFKMDNDDIENELKNLLTTNNKMYNEKNEKAESATNFTNCIFFSNHGLVIRISSDDRRFVIIRCDNRFFIKYGIQKDDPAYFETIANADENDFIALMWYFHTHLNNINVRKDRPRTLAYLDHQIDSMDNYQKWFLSIISKHDDYPQRDWFDQTVERSLVFDNFQECTKSEYNRCFFSTLNSRFQINTNKKRGGRTQRFVEFPSLEKLTELFVQSFRIPLTKDELEYVLDKHC